MARVRVIGCGNPDAGDDAVGLIAVREARPRLERVPGVDVVEAGPALNVVHLLEGADAAVIVDAVWAPGGGRAPGEIVRVDVGNDGVPVDVGTSLSSHGLGLAEAIGLAAALDGAPRIVFLGMEAADVAAGRPLSPAVAAAVPELAGRILAEAEVLSETLKRTAHDRAGHLTHLRTSRGSLGDGSPVERHLDGKEAPMAPAGSLAAGGSAERAFGGGGLSESSCPGVQEEDGMPRFEAIARMAEHGHAIQIFHDRERRRGALGMHTPIEFDKIEAYPTAVVSSLTPRIPGNIDARRMTHDEGLRGPGHIHFEKDSDVRASRHRGEVAWR